MTEVKLTNAPFEEVREFLKGLEAAGFPTEAMQHFNRRPDELRKWVASANLANVPKINLHTPVEEFFDDRRIAWLLKRSDISTIEDLLDWTWNELLEIRQCAERTASLIKLQLESHGLRLSERTDDQARSDPTRILILASSDRPLRYWRRDKIGPLPLGAFARFSFRNTRGAEFVAKEVDEKIESLASMSKDEIMSKYGLTLGRLIIAWIDENYRPWIK